MTSGLEPFRKRLDWIDDELTRLFSARFAVCREIALYKSAHEIPMMQPERVEQVRTRYLARGAELGSAGGLLGGAVRAADRRDLQDGG